MHNPQYDILCCGGLHLAFGSAPPSMLLGSRASIEPKSRRKKGEEKPEEELMGKRKSSPWLATTS
jgi:hypothetical protein